MLGTPQLVPTDDRILIDIDGLDATFALVSPKRGSRPHSMRRYKTIDFPTATDCIMNFSNDAKIQLSGKDCVVVVSGAVYGDSIRIARSRWIISRMGFGYLFQKSVHFMNDSAAMLWGSTIANSTTHRSHGALGLPDFKTEGKWIGINYQTGLGAALLIGSTDNGFQHIETEAGHTAFSAMNEIEQTLLGNLARSKAPVSWERALFAEVDDLAWKETPIAGNSQLLAQHRSEILGSFVGDMILSTGSWSGVLLFGNCNELLSNSTNAALFAKRLEARANFQIGLRNVPRWAVAAQDIKLAGAAAFLNAKIDN